MWAACGLTSNNHSQDFYDVKWNKLDLSKPDMCNFHLTMRLRFVVDIFPRETPARDFSVTFFALRASLLF